MQQFVIAKLQVEGFHNWADAFDEVSFLRDSHRHIFHIKAKKQVRHGDRDTEFIVLKRRIEKFMNEKWGTPCQFDGMSCEMIALEIYKEFKLESCYVFEDNENGGGVEK